MDGFLRILVAEENEVDSFVIQCELSKLDMAFTFKRVASRKEYFSQLEEFHPNLVLANSQFNGAEIILKTRAKFPKIPMMMMVSVEDEPSINGLLKQGATDCLMRRQLPQLKDAVEKVIRHCKVHKGEPVASPTCFETNPASKKSFLDRYFGAPAKNGEAVANGRLNGSHVAGQKEAPTGTSFGTKIARIKNKFRTTQPVVAGESAPDNRKEMQQALAAAETRAAGEGVCATPANPSVAGAGSSLIDGMPSPLIPCSYSSRSGTEAEHLRQMEKEQVERNALLEQARKDFEKGPAIPTAKDDLKDLIKQAQSFAITRGKDTEEEENEDNKWVDQLQKLNKELKDQMIARKNAEVSLQKREAAFNTLFERSLLPLFLLDDSGSIMQVNPAACLLLSYSAAELLGRRLIDFTDDDTKPLMEEAWSAFLANGEQKGERRFITATNHVCDVEFTTKARVINGQHLLVCRDITLQKTLREELNRARMQLGRSASDHTTQSQKLEELERKALEYHRKEEIWNKTRHELDQLLMEKAHEIEHLAEQLKTELAHRQRLEEDLKTLHVQLSSTKNDRTAEDRQQLSRIVNETIDKNLTRLQHDLKWVTERLTQADEGVPRKQLLDVLESMETMMGEAVLAVQKISGELARLAPPAAGRR